MIRLSQQQRQEMVAAHETPPRVVDPDTNCQYVLLRADLYEKIRGLFEDVPISDREEDALIREAGLIAGWIDPELDVYNDLVPRKP